jgi:hypothetical protein
MDISHLFNQYAGKEVQVTESHRSMNIGGHTYNFDEVSPVDNEPTLAAMKKTAEDNGLSLRVFFPGWGGTCDYDTSRVNANVDKGVDGKWRVQSGFSLG